MSARKRKLPASLGLVPNGRAQVTPRSPVAAAPAAAATASSPSKRHATESAVHTQPHSRVAHDLHLDATASLHSPPSVSCSPPPLIPLDAAIAATPVPVSAASSSCHAVVSSSSAAATPMRFTGAHSSLPFAAPARSLPSAVPFDAAAASRSFPLLDLPADVLSVVVSFMHIWDACFLRGTAQALRRISGLNGGDSGPPRIRKNPARRRGDASSSVTAVASSAAMDSAADEDEGSDQFRFWHHYTSLDFRSLLQGWREFERQRRRMCEQMAAAAAATAVTLDRNGATNVIDLLSPSPSPMPPDSPLLPNTITIFDSDDDDVGEAGLRSGNASAPDDADAAAASSASAVALSSPVASPELPSSLDPYDRLQRVIAPFAAGFPRLRAAALDPAGSHPPASEDLCTSSEDDVWLLHFLRTHRLPFVTHVHFGYTTLHSPLLSHLAAFCCSAPASDVGTLTDLSLQFSDKSPGRWLDTALRMGPLHTLSLDFTPAQKPVWPTLAPTLLSSSMARTLQDLKLIGPNTGSASMPAAILEVISAGLPCLRQVLVAHGLITTQRDLAAACRGILQSSRWPLVESLRLVHFPLIDDALPLFDALAQRRNLRTLALEQCINLRIPLVELPPKPKTAATASKKKKSALAAAARAESPPPAATKSKSADPSIPIARAPRLPVVHSLTLSHCGSLTVPSLRSLPVLCPSLRRLDLSGHDSKSLSGSALKLLMDPAIFGALESLKLANCPQIDDHAWDGLPKKTRMMRLREIDLSLGRTHRALGPAVMKRSGAVGRAVQQAQDTSSIQKRFTDHGLSLLCVYCPALTSLNLSGQLFLSAAALSQLFTRLTLLSCLIVHHHPMLDVAWIRSVLRLPITHALEMRMSLTRTMMQSAAAELLGTNAPGVSAECMATKSTDVAAAAAAASSSSPPTPTPLIRAPSTLTANSSHAGIARTKLCQQLQQYVADHTHRRVTLQLRM